MKLDLYSIFSSQKHDCLVAYSVGFSQEIWNSLTLAVTDNFRYKLQLSQEKILLYGSSLLRPCPRVDSVLIQVVCSFIGSEPQTVKIYYIYMIPFYYLPSSSMLYPRGGTAIALIPLQARIPLWILCTNCQAFQSVRIQDKKSEALQKIALPIFMVSHFYFILFYFILV